MIRISLGTCSSVHVPFNGMYAKVEKLMLKWFLRYRQVNCMPGQQYCFCGNIKSSDPNAPLHIVPKEVEKWAFWLELLSLQEEVTKPSTRVYSRHFPDGDVSKLPSTSLGKRFTSPFKKIQDHLLWRWEKNKEFWRNTVWCRCHRPAIVLIFQQQAHQV